MSAEFKESVPLAAVRHKRSVSSEQPVETWDVFISHASEDKGAVARPLAEALKRRGVRVWLDELNMKIGDSLRRKIDNAIASSSFAVVIISPQFLAKGWTMYELDGIITKSVNGEQNILPVWHGVKHSEVMSFSPNLADKVARSTSSTPISEIAQEIAQVIRDS